MHVSMHPKEPEHALKTVKICLKFYSKHNSKKKQYVTISKTLI